MFFTLEEILETARKYGVEVHDADLMNHQEAGS